MTRPEDVTYARQRARAEGLSSLMMARSVGYSGQRALYEASRQTGYMAGVHLADSTQVDDLAMVWAKEYAKVSKALQHSMQRCMDRKRGVLSTPQHGERRTS
jgi:hypothetical protein